MHGKGMADHDMHGKDGHDMGCCCGGKDGMSCGKGDGKDGMACGKDGGCCGKAAPADKTAPPDATKKPN
jgi:hypothetical protein